MSFIVKKNTDDRYKNFDKVIKKNDGYCPCALLKDDSTKCICKDFVEKIENPEFEGKCKCGYYIKINV